jgi:hypothetical protein
MPMANDHHGSEMGNPVAKCTATPIALPSPIPSSPPADVRKTASMRNCHRISMRRDAADHHPNRRQGQTCSSGTS